MKLNGRNILNLGLEPAISQVLDGTYLIATQWVCASILVLKEIHLHSHYEEVWNIL